MGSLTFNTDTLNKIVDGRLNSFRQDIADSEHTIENPQIITGGVPVRFTIDTLSRNNVVAPGYITSRWDAINSKIAFPEELDSPTYVFTPNFVFAPTAASEGTVTIRAYIDDIVPKLIKTVSKKYKGVTSPEGLLLTWYLGTEEGYNAKVDGVYFEIEFEGDGNLYDKSATIYRT